MKFKEGKVIEKFISNDKTFVIRYPKKTDVKGFMNYINSLVHEKSMIIQNKKVTYNDEKKWLLNNIQSCKKNQMMHLCVTDDDVIISSTTLTLGDMSEHKLGYGFGIGVHKKYRRYGIAKKLFSILEKIIKTKGISVIRSSYYSGNKNSYMLHKKLGFKKSGVIPKSIDYYGKMHDEIFMYKVLK